MVTSLFMDRKVWLVTGTSTGIGLSTVKQLLKQGYHVAATTRSQSRLLENLGSCDQTHLLVLEVDLMNDEEIKDAVDKTISHFGQLDVVMNNAGFGQLGPLEELSRQTLIDQFQINVFAVHSFIKYSLPHFRARKNGCFLTCSSLAAIRPEPGIGAYAASKAAITALTETIADECAEFGIKAISLEPGSFETKFFDAAVVTDSTSGEYQQIHRVFDFVKTNKARKAGDPDKAAQFFIELANHPNPPKRLFIGKMACEFGGLKLDELAKDVGEWKARSLATDYDP
jgi:NAD(P)-dependent dehydrogenase (short-subunit alcohol dehydrogenase family)